MNKIAVIGPSGSGKSHLAKELSEHFELPVIDLDDVILDENYEKPSLEIYRKRVLADASKDQWVIEGVYPKVGDIVWTLADAVVWLNLPFETVRERYEKRDKQRERNGPFPEIDIHKKEYMKLARLYPEMLGQLSISNVVEITDPDYILKDALFLLEN
jgi:adenylate kinase family enzyme